MPAAAIILAQLGHGDNELYKSHPSVANPYFAQNIIAFSSACNTSDIVLPSQSSQQLSYPGGVPL